MQHKNLLSQEVTEANAVDEYQDLNCLMRLLIFRKSYAYRTISLSSVLLLLLGPASFLNTFSVLCSTTYVRSNFVLKLEAWVALRGRSTGFMPPRARSGGNVVCWPKTYWCFFSERTFFSPPWSILNTSTLSLHYWEILYSNRYLSIISAQCSCCSYKK